MEKLYSLAFLFLPLFVQSQQLAFTKPVPPGFPSVELRSAPKDDGKISADELSRNIGKQVSLCGKVYSAKEEKDELGIHSVFHISGKYVNEFIDLKIRFDEGYEPSDEMYESLTSKDLCISGIVVDEAGGPGIYMDSLNLQKLFAEAEQAQRSTGAEALQDQELKVKSNAYLLTGPRWKDPVITFLKAGSVIIAEQVRGDWAFVRVIEKSGENVEVEDIAGYINTKPLGLKSNGTIIVPR
jgi:hypothetical protein